MTATGIHLLDLSVGVFGPAETVYASVKQLGSALVNGDTLAILATYKSGGHALISAILATPFVGRFAVYCSQGWVEVRDKSHPEASTGWLLTYCKRGEAEQSIAYEPYPAVLANLEAFADAAQGRKPYPVPQEQMLANICAQVDPQRPHRAGRSGLIGQRLAGMFNRRAALPPMIMSLSERFKRLTDSIKPIGSSSPMS
jgi:predicted dehydrogenase